MIDPARSFEQPIVSEGGIPTVVLANAVAAGIRWRTWRGCSDCPALGRGGAAVRAAARPPACRLKVFIDNNLSPYLAHALNTLLEPEGDQA
ncbi:MAG TPA: hypothetical protein VFX06_09980 [Stellaceae bacterium]|nr:hypothetical protein [Stellaceae bacterium]